MNEVTFWQELDGELIKNTYLKMKKSCRGGICAVMAELGEHQIADLPKFITLKASEFLTFNRKYLQLQ